MTGLYHADYYGWTQEQAALLKSGQLQALDRDHLAEEIEAMGKSQQRELESRLKILFMHLLKWQYQPAYRGNSWRYSIEEQRSELADHLADNPSLRARLPEALERAYRYARLAAAKETGLVKDQFPQTRPWSFEQAMDNDYWPD